MESVPVQRGIQYSRADAGALVMDVYVPPDAKAGERRPAVVIVAGYPDRGFETMLGCKFKDMGSSVSWARLLAMSGLAAITYANREPVRDLAALLDYVRENAGELGVDAGRIGFWSTPATCRLRWAR